MLVSDKLYIFTRFLDLRAFAGFRGCFADFYGRFAGNFGRSYVSLYIYMRWCLGYENGLVCSWDAARMHAIFNHIQSYSKFQLRK